MQHSSHKLYILIDRTLTSSQQAVQACHASIEFAKAYPDWEHQSLVLLAVDNEQKLDTYYNWLSEKGFRTIPFFESYWNDRLTAVACHGCDEAVSGLPLL
jgi:hypothetical protein